MKQLKMWHLKRYEKYANGRFSIILSLIISTYRFIPALEKQEIHPVLAFIQYFLVCWHFFGRLTSWLFPERNRISILTQLIVLFKLYDGEMTKTCLLAQTFRQNFAHCSCVVLKPLSLVQCTQGYVTLVSSLSLTHATVWVLV